jgi:predicted CXXCH cytochrome family protein
MAYCKLTIDWLSDCSKCHNYHVSYSVANGVEQKTSFCVHSACIVAGLTKPVLLAHWQEIFKINKQIKKFLK